MCDHGRDNLRSIYLPRLAYIPWYTVEYSRLGVLTSVGIVARMDEGPQMVPRQAGDVTYYKLNLPNRLIGGD